MRTVHFYDKATGIIHPHRFTTSDETLIAVNTPLGHAAIAGVFDRLSQRVDVSDPSDHHVIDYQPPASSVDHEWNATTKRWQLTAAAQSKRNAAAAATAQIRFLELNVLPRALRELALDQAGAKDRIAKIDAEIAELRKELSK